MPMYMSGDAGGLPAALSPADSRPATLEQEGGLVLGLLPCPDCGLPAEITDSFTLQSTDGPVDHVALGCVDGHHFRMAVDRLPGDRQQLRAGLARNGPDVARRPPAPGAGFGRLPGRLGTVGSADC